MIRCNNLELSKKTVYTTLLRLGVSAAVLVWLFSQTDTATVLETFGRLPLVIWVVSVFFFLTLCLLAATRWFLLSGILGLSGRWFTYVGYYFIGQFFNLFMPTSVGGDFFKILFVSKGQQSGLLVSTCGVIADRFIGLLTMFLTGTIAVLMYPGEILPGKNEWLLYCGAFVIVGLLFFVPFLYYLLRTFRSTISEELALLRTIWEYPAVLIKIAGLSVALNSILISIIIVLATSIGIDVHPSYFFAIFPLTAIVTVLPFSFNGMGLREGAFVYLLSLQNVPFEKALSLSLCLFVVQCSAGFAGGIAYAIGLHKKNN